MKMFYSTVFFVVIVLSLISCKSPTEPEAPKELIPYMSLNIGDIRQFYDDPEGIYFQWKVVDTTKRADGQKVYELEESIYLSDVSFQTTLYYFIKDNYFLRTELNSVSNNTLNEKNKFDEQKLAKIFPKIGDYFLRTEGVADSEQVFFKVSFIDSLKTNCGKFKNVAQYEMIDSDSSSSQWIYYAPRYGHIGTIIANEYGTAKIFATYIKVGDEEIGEYTPLSSRKLITNQKWKVNIQSYLFGK